MKKLLKPQTTYLLLCKTVSMSVWKNLKRNKQTQQSQYKIKSNKLLKSFFA